MRLRRNRKSQVYPVVIVIFTIIALTSALLALNNAKKVEDTSSNEMLLGEKQAAVFFALQDADAINLFLDEAAELSAQIAWDKISNSCFVNVNEEQEVDEWESPCGKYVYPLWSTNDSVCLPNCETAFITAFKDDFLKRTGEYYSMTGIELPISYNLTIKKDEKHFLLYGVSDTDNAFNVLSIDIRLKNPLAIAQAYEGGDFIWPVQYSDHTITSCFGERDIGEGASRNHPAIDIRAPKGTPVLAAASGKVTLVDPCWGRVVINHGSGLSTDYLHMDTWSVRVNDDVVRGQKIGTSGERGEKDSECRADAYKKFGAHLHFAVIYKGVPSTLNYLQKKVVLKTDHIQPLCLIEKGYYFKQGSNCDTPVSTDLDKVCELYNFPKESSDEPEEQNTNSQITGNVPAPLYPDSLSKANPETEETEVSTSFGSYSFTPAFTTRINQKIEDPLKPVTDWFTNTWLECDDDPKKCINNKMKEFNAQDNDFKLSFADRCEKGYHVFYDMMEFMEDCLSDKKYACSCEFNISEVFSITDLQIVFDTEENTTTLYAKQSDSTYKSIKTYEFYYGKITRPQGSVYRYYVYQLGFDDYGNLESARLVQMKNPLDILDTVTFDDYKVLKLTKPEKAKQGFFTDITAPLCQYNKNKFRLCAKPKEERDDLFTLKFSFHLRDKPPEPIKDKEVSLTAVDQSTEELVDTIPGAASILTGIFPPLGFLFTAANLLNVLDDFKPQKYEVTVDIPIDKDGNPLDVAGYEVYCSDYLTDLLPTDFLGRHDPSQFVVMANSGINSKVSQLDNYVNTNPYADFLNLKDCKVPVSKFTGETIMVPGIKGVVRDGKMVFNLHKCGQLSIIIDKLIRKNYCVSLIPVDKNGNKLMDNAVSNCVQSNSLLDLLVTEMIEKELGAFLPSSLIPADLQPYIKLPGTDDIINAVTGDGDINMIDVVNFDKLDADLKKYLEDFVVGTINEDIVGTSFVNSIEDLKVWERQTVLNTLSNQIKNEDASFLFNSFISGNDVSDSVKRRAFEKGVDYLDDSKAPEILKEVAKGEDPESLAYNELLKAANKELSSDDKKQDLLDIAQSSTGSEVKDKIIEKAVEKGCSENYGISVEQALDCLGQDEIDDIYQEVLTSYTTPDSVKEKLLNKAVDKLGDKAPSVLKNVVLTRDFKGVAYDMLEKELDKMPDSLKQQYVKDILEGRLPDVSILQSELVKKIPALDNGYVNALLRDGNVKSLIESNLKGYLESQLSSFFSGECKPINID